MPQVLPAVRVTSVLSVLSVRVTSVLSDGEEKSRAPSVAGSQSDECTECTSDECTE